MDAFRQWALSLIIASAAATLALTLSHGRSSDKTVRAVAGIFVVSAICTPLLSVFKTDFYEDAFALTDFSAYGEENLNEFLLDTYKTELEKIILSEAENYGVSVDKIFISADIDADNCIIIHEISLGITEADTALRSGFLQYISLETGFEITLTDD